MTHPETDLTVAVTGPTGTFGSGLVPLLQADDRVSRVVGIARRPFDPAARGWTKMAYRQGDVRDAGALADAFAGADVVVHLAFLITGNAGRQTTRAINVDGTLNAFRAAAAAGARRFVYASSVAAYGFHPDNPVGMTEQWPTRPAARLFYAQEKAELEQLLAEESARYPQVQLYLVRPPLVLGPDAVGGKDLLPGPLAPLGRRLAGLAIRPLPVPVPVLVPALQLQLVHSDDVGQALQRCVVAAGPPGAYNIAGDGVLTLADVARAYGAVPVSLPAGPAQRVARAVSRLPFLPATAEWVEALSHPAVMDTTKAREQLGWRPRYTGLQALQDTLATR
ncbi:NAD-dependent epimerase/dehydratase family protein [Modestobacter sp. I12A-02628]|uniref:NAD-dependent epimerase/dehydratase family protein n=1 Tax=Goekera deserti TaxID=2497753 RepID=A0A7K3WJ12_9ACTN|nr:NAD-dependent epimerase/dehydratase family protein [Goekera deserti]MPQ99045.1 NAD-dependent epimerase/dehydratase family protein [Goekera deserti]NDI47379.1 NAD-dependent epimerase/dehydratase family protein [Goekera deserti]NEL55909.1 NAD-dependent epimerase/dehydratase family protein [Goekera deserti]